MNKRVGKTDMIVEVGLTVMCQDCPLLAKTISLVSHNGMVLKSEDSNYKNQRTHKHMTYLSDGNEI